MASRQGSKKSTGKSNTNKKNTNRQTVKQSEAVKQRGTIQDEIILVIALVISVLLFLSNFNLCGQVGRLASNFIFGMVGMEAFVLPFAIFFGTAFHISNPGNKKAGRKIISAVIFLIAFSAMVQLISMNYDSSMKILDYYNNSFRNRSGGGIIGGILVMILCGLFDTLASYIILSAIMAISIIIITGKAIFSLIAKKGSKSLEQRKEYQRLRYEQMQEAAENRINELENTRRAPKTFILDPAVQTKEPKENDMLHPAKQVKSKKTVKENLNKPEEELPVINLDHLFDMEEIKPQSDKPNNKPVSNSNFSYEEELRNKFGNSDDSPMKETESEPEQYINPVKISAEPELYQTANANSDDTSNQPEIILEKEEKQAEKAVNQVIHKESTDVEQLNINQNMKEKAYLFPPTSLLASPKVKAKVNSDSGLKETAIKLQSTLESFGVHVNITNVSCGPAVTRYELQLDQGVKVKSITSLADDIKLNLAAADIRIEAPIPGKAAVGIEVPNKENTMVSFRDMIESDEFKKHSSDIAFAVGKDIGGQTVVTDIGKMPHLLIAGATGSGKSVCINTLIMSILYKAKPSDVRMIMVDPKVVELNVYNGIPHLLIPVVTDPKKASAALNWAVMEMTERYKKFADAGVRDLKGYNEKAAEVAYLNDESCQKLPQIVIIIDELADLMMVAPGEVEDSICRLAQMARAAGLHLIIATQRPSVNVITGLIKANVPSRIAFAVSSAIDSRTIIDGAGAEKLLGKGDMLFFPSGYPKPVRIQGAFISDKEVSSVVDFLKEHNNDITYNEEIKDQITNAKAIDSSLGSAGANDRDDYFAEAGKFIIEKDKASIGMLQRVYKIGFNRAARIMDQLAEAGVVGPEEGTKPRKVLMSEEQFEQYLEEN